nr:sugar-binding domain-containing protein [Soonwooa sp.]
MTHKIIPDPFLDENEKKVQWIENEDWEYRSHYTITNKEWSNLNKVLIFEGLDAFSEIHINGRPLTKTLNMFAPEVVYLSDYLREGENVLTIRFTSGVKEGKELAKEIPFQLCESPRSLVRKAQYQFGWDWGPRLVTAGIWKDVKLITWDIAKIENIRVDPKSINTKKADLVFHTEIDAPEIGNDDLEKLHVSINGKIYKNLKLKSELNKVSFPFEIKKPKLW